MCDCWNVRLRLISIKSTYHDKINRLSGLATVPCTSVEPARCAACAQYGSPLLYTRPEDNSKFEGILYNTAYSTHRSRGTCLVRRGNFIRTSFEHKVTTVKLEAFRSLSRSSPLSTRSAFSLAYSTALSLKYTLFLRTCVGTARQTSASVMSFCSK